MPAQDGEKDRFGLPYMTSEQEVATSFVLFAGGVAFLLPVLYSLRGHGLNAAYLGVVMLGASYLFLVESVRELEEEDHFLSRKLRKNQ